MPREDTKDADMPCRASQSLFATTHWSVVLAAGGQTSRQSVDALERLCRTYWYPLYAFVRRKGYAVPEAEDLTQEFFARLLRHNFPQGITPRGGKFRSYLLTSLQHFLTNEWLRDHAQKRGAGVPVISLQELNAEDRYQREPTDHTTPETLFDRQWATVLLARVRERLRLEYESQNKAIYYEHLHHCLTGAESIIPYQTLARQLDCSESAIKMAVHRMRKRYGELLRLEISQTVVGPSEVDEEIRTLVAAL